MVGLSFSCSESFFDLKPQGRASLEQLSNKNGVGALLIGAYSLMDGVGAGNTGRQSTISNYVFGGISSDDAVKGTDAGDQPEQSFIEQYNWLSDNTYFLGKWWHSYDGVARCNEVIQIVSSAAVKDMTEAEKTQVIAEARFLRAHYHFEAKKCGIKCHLSTRKSTLLLTLILQKCLIPKIFGLKLKQILILLPKIFLLFKPRKAVLRSGLLNRIWLRP